MYVSDDELNSLMMPVTKLDGESDRAHSQRIFEVNGPEIAQSIVDIALTGKSDSVRLRAATYCMDRILGPTSMVMHGPSADDALMEAVRAFSAVTDNK